MRKYDTLANEIGLIYRAQTKIIPYVLTWDGVVTKFHKKYVKEIGLSTRTEAYIQSRVLKKTLDSISFDRRRNLGEGEDCGGSIEEAIERLKVTDHPDTRGIDMGGQCSGRPSQSGQ